MASCHTMFPLFLKREQSMGMVIELTVIRKDHITVERHQFQHSLNLLRLKTTFLRYEHLQFSTTTPTDARENG